MAALLTQGQTGELGVADVTVTVHFSAGIDLAALLLTDRGTPCAATPIWSSTTNPPGPVCNWCPGRTPLP
ncbi:hypothetical protein [Nocardia sp. CDC160]|uniref:hypothetical protein n=1 Tax=Nocardia sp. CDC160 TaxID=3112166 RepID=UPI002DBEF6AD|nr:hypothetical protein [Nocardia sp. CDC160]MEC3915810.1 hypothetical protein [Nocardia sp. CDC160]